MQCTCLTRVLLQLLNYSLLPQNERLGADSSSHCFPQQSSSLAHPCLLVKVDSHEIFRRPVAVRPQPPGKDLGWCTNIFLAVGFGTSHGLSVGQLQVAFTHALCTSKSTRSGGWPPRTPQQEPPAPPSRYLPCRRTCPSSTGAMPCMGSRREQWILSFRSA